MDLDLVYLPATEALARFRDRSLSPVELTQALIERAEQVEPTVNALCIRYPEQALEQARQAEARYAGHGEPPRPLEGLCVGIKDEMPIEGQSLSGGSLVYRDLVADHTDPMGDKLIRAGAILHARTTAPEFSCAAFTHSKQWGITRNPWNPEFAVGGSSGGSGASLASGTSTLATGSDIGGSIRIPAGWNGVVGFKPPFGRVPQMPPWNLDQYCHQGPMARTVADCALFENVVAGPHPLDPVAIAPVLTLPDTFEPVTGLRVAYCLSPGGWPIDPDVAENTRQAALALAEAGAVVEEIEMSSLWSPENVMDVAMAHFGAIMGALIATELAEHRDLLMDYSIDLAERTTGHTGKSFAEGLLAEVELMADLAGIHERYDLLLVPTNVSRGLVAGESYVGTAPEIGGVTPDFYLTACFTTAFNICSRSPVLSVPSGFADNGVPTGVQLVGRPYDDLTPFRAGAALEQVRPWSGHRPLA